MKKIYQTPNTIIVRVQTAKMIANSPGYRLSTDETEGNLSRRRGRSVWDDDEEDY